MKRTFALALVLALVMPAIPVTAQQQTSRAGIREQALPGEGPIARAARVEALATSLAAAVPQESPTVAAVREQAGRISAGDKVVVTMLTGEKVDGTLLEVRENEIVVSRPRDKGYDAFGNKVHDATPAGELALSFESIRSIKKPVSGRKIGAIVGTIVGVWAVAAMIRLATLGS